MSAPGSGPCVPGREDALNTATCTRAALRKNGTALVIARVASVLPSDAIKALFEQMMRQAEQRRLLSTEHFSVDGTLVRA